MIDVKNNYKNRLEVLKLKKKEMQEVVELKNQIKEEEKAIKALKPKNWFMRLFTKDEYQ